VSKMNDDIEEITPEEMLNEIKKNENVKQDEV
jgi:hypothetical protein